MTTDVAYSVDESSNLLDALKVMVEKQCHRVLVLNSRGEIVSMITQSRILQFLSTMTDSLPDNEKSIHQLGLGFKTVCTVQDNCTVYDAFKKMKEAKVPALPVVDKDGILIGNLSANDLKVIRKIER